MRLVIFLLRWCWLMFLCINSIFEQCVYTLQLLFGRCWKQCLTAKLLMIWLVPTAHIMYTCNLAYTMTRFRIAFKIMIVVICLNSSLFSCFG
ncbi:hypothetical protein KC19_VG179100 [Ceratodon purpureus]|uniref:Uncharacterized protein n=1 Tax=Ceratodon purpureus TaxID=3225 RepID=A0A8T0HRU1_CERPU|nr:hypothetical protein KC19_VG179100 [Ceratodon purpureus]